ncbi:MAG TPA: hypothetical protein VIU61_01520 [Kofleriaceae bacterium]
MTSRWITALLFAMALAGCTKSSTGMNAEPSPTQTKPTPAPDPQPEVKPDRPAASFTVEIASVTLADQCGSNGRMQPPMKTAQAPAKPADPAVVAPSSPARRAPGQGPLARRACEQTSMQLSLKAPAAEQVTVKKVELLDANGTLINELLATAPQKWDGAAYAAWDQKLAAGDDVVVAYALGSPDWNKIGGRYAANGKTFQLRVTLVVGTTERVVEKQAISAAHIEPAVPT